MMDLAAQEHIPATAGSQVPRTLSYSYPPPNLADEEIGFATRLRRHKLLFLTVFFAIMTADVLSYFVIPKLYKADALLTIDSPEQILASQSSNDHQQLTVGDSADLESQSIIITSSKILDAVVLQEKVQAALLRECRFTTAQVWKRIRHQLLDAAPEPPCESQLPTVGSLKGRVTVSLSGRSRVLTVSFYSPLPDIARTMANAIVETYLDTQRWEKLQPRDEAITWLRNQIGTVEDRLKLTETSIESVLHTNGVVRGESAPVASEQLTSLAQQIATAEAERAATAGRMQQAEQSDATTGVLENRTVNDDKQQLSIVNSKIAQLSARYGSAYPALADLQQQRRVLEQAIVQDTSVVQRSSFNDAASANQRVALLVKRMDEIKEEVHQNDLAKVRVASLERTLATDRELYLNLSKDLGRLETDRRMVTSNVRLISLAELPTTIFFPKASSFVLTGVLLAMVMGCVAVLLVDRRDKSVRSVTGLQTAAELRVFARVPHLTRAGRGTLKMRQGLETPSVFQEAIRRLYAECLLVNGRVGNMKRRPQTLLVTSSDRGEGKTFTTLALAHFAAGAGHRVLVLECDLRQPSIAGSLLQLPRWGVSEILRGQVRPEEAVMHSSSSGLDIIAAGEAVPDSAELLSGDRLIRLTSWAAANYDLVLIDSPPAQILPDARILATAVDGILYCARWGLSDTALVIQGIRALCAAGGNVIGLVLNDCDLARLGLYDKSTIEFSGYFPAR